MRFNAWRHQSARQAATFFIKHTAAKAFNSWAAFTSERRHKAAGVRAALRHWQTSALVAAFGGWREAVAVRVQNRYKVSASLLKLRNQVCQPDAKSVHKRRPEAD
jgi:hypothetical protein